MIKTLIEIFSAVCIIVAIYYLAEENAAQTSFWIGLAIYNHITANKKD